MRLLLATSFFILLEARSTPIQDKIRRFLDFMQTVRGNGALAIQTPTGLWPVNQITEANIPLIFGFHHGLRQELEETRQEAKSKGKTVIPERFSADSSTEFVRRESKQSIVSATPLKIPGIRSEPPKSVPPLNGGRLPPHALHHSGYNSAAANAPSFGGLFNPPFDSESSLDAGLRTEKIAREGARSGSTAFALPPSNISVDPAPEFGEDIAVGLKK